MVWLVRATENWFTSGICRWSSYFSFSVLCWSIKQVPYKQQCEFYKNLSEEVLTDTQISLLTKGLKFIPTATVKKNKIKRQLLQDYKAFVRRMRLKYIFRGQNKSIHPFHVKSNWEPPVQPSVTLEHYLEEVKLQIANSHLSRKERNETKQRSKF